MEEESPESSHRLAPQSQDGESLEFITFTDPETARTGDNRRRVRSQAMRHVHRRSAPRVNKNEIELDITPLLQASHRNPGTLGTHQAESSSQGSSQDLLTILDASRLDPFFQYPIPMVNRERQLYDHREFVICQHYVNLINVTSLRWNLCHVSNYARRWLLKPSPADSSFLSIVGNVIVACSSYGPKFWADD
jgi:hypothetical protein